MLNPIRHDGTGRSPLSAGLLRGKMANPWPGDVLALVFAYQGARSCLGTKAWCCVGELMGGPKCWFVFFWCFWWMCFCDFVVVIDGF
jgi:hypothetical protein